MDKCLHKVEVIGMKVRPGDMFTATLFADMASAAVRNDKPDDAVTVQNTEYLEDA